MLYGLALMLGEQKGILEENSTLFFASQSSNLLSVVGEYSTSVYLLPKRLNIPDTHLSSLPCN